jgi:uncharacterized protein YqhQ
MSELLPARRPAAKLRLGGMALRNGLLLHGPTSWAAAVRRTDGSIAVASGHKPRLRVADGIPGVRGVVRLAEAMLVIPLVKRALPEAQLPFQNAGVLGAAAAARVVSNRLRRREAAGPATELGAALVSLAPALSALRSGELAAYHGAEHKTIAAYEHDDSEAADAAKEHDRCGSHLMTPLLLSNLAGLASLRWMGMAGRPWASGAVSLGSLGVSVEVFGWSERHPRTRLARLLRRPGYELQRTLGTREPDERQLDVARSALQEILRAERVTTA